MICPQCGYDIGTKHRCLRCGYEVKTLVAVDEEEQKRREKEENTHVIDPENTYLTDEYGNIVGEEEDDFFADPISSIFGDLFGFDPIGDLLGGLFGVPVGRRSRANRYREEVQEIVEKKPKKIVEVNKVEFLDENGNPVDKDKDKGKTKNRKNKKDD